MDHALAADLRGMIAADDALRESLRLQGRLFGGYDPAMAALHRDHGRRLLACCRAGGWPGRSRVGDEAAAAAWRIAQHALPDPPTLRALAPFLAAAVAAGEADPAGWAMLQDRIAVCEGRTQTYGTQHDWDDDGRLSPMPIADPAGVDARRASAGLEPLAEQTARLRARAAAEGDTPPADPAAHRAAGAAWARSVGWRD
ncbi:MAG: hypothetical protein RLZZ127_731 [Planctomycetota bacterium]|jgi:hypothetical protein